MINYFDFDRTPYFEPRYAYLDEAAGEVKRYKWNPSFGWTRNLPPMPILEADSVWVPSRRPIP